MAEVQEKGARVHPGTGPAGEAARARLLAAMPVAERRLGLAGIPTAVLTGGEGTRGVPIVLLHGPSGYAAHWLRVLPRLAETHRVIAPDLPGHGASTWRTGSDAEDVIAWLGDLIGRTCDAPPVLVGHLLGGAIGARFASRHGERLSRLVLVDALGLRPFSPAPELGLALEEFLAHPGERTHGHLWRYCAHDAAGLQRRMRDVWDSFAAYNIDRARSADAQAATGALMQAFALPAIPPEELARISVPTTLIWGRHDLATPLAVAEAASTRYGWPLRVIDACADDPPVERPAAFVRELLAALAAATSRPSA